MKALDFLGPIIVTGLVVGIIFLIATAAAPSPSGFKYDVVLIDGCEYIKFHTDHAIIHKANCKNHEQ